MKTTYLRTATFSLLALVATNVFAADAEPKTLLTERGKVLFSDDFERTPMAGWNAAKGKWEIADGALRGAEVAADKHGAVNRRALPFGDAVLQFSFRLEGAKGISLSINKEKGHLCRVSINPAGFTVQKDDSDKAGPDKAAVLQKVTTPITTGEWHTLVVELLGSEMVASLDGEKIGFGAHESIANPKANFGFTVAGQSASFKNVRVWEAQPNKNWSKTKATLAAAPAE